MHLRSFLADQISPKRVRRQQQFEREVVSLDGLAAEGDRSYEPTAGEMPEQAFDRALARSVIQAVRQELRKRCEIEKRADDYALFAAAVPEEAWEESMSQQALVERFGKSRDHVRGVLERLKKRVRRLLHIELRDHGASEADLEAETAELLRLLSR